MADITQTPANVDAGTGAGYANGTAGETIVAGDMLYIKAADGKLWKAINSAAASAVAVGIALDGGAAGQPITYQTRGGIDVGGTVVVGEIYCVSANAGKLAIEADVTTAKYVTIIGVGTASDNIKMGILVSGVPVPA